MKWFNIFKKKKPVDSLEVIAGKYDLDEHDWSSVDDASDYLYEHKVNKRGHWKPYEPKPIPSPLKLPGTWEDKLKPKEAELEPEPLEDWEALEESRKPIHPKMESMKERYRIRSRKPLRRRKD